jgi:hypothetical protein
MSNKKSVFSNAADKKSSKVFSSFTKGDIIFINKVDVKFIASPSGKWVVANCLNG